MSAGALRLLCRRRHRDRQKNSRQGNLRAHETVPPTQQRHRADAKDKYRIAPIRAVGRKPKMERDFGAPALSAGDRISFGCTCNRGGRKSANNYSAAGAGRVLKNPILFDGRIGSFLTPEIQIPISRKVPSASAWRRAWPLRIFRRPARR
jgi:hypothetical protein